MDVQRRIIVQALKTSENILIPIWDERVSFEKIESYGGNVIHIKGESGYFSPIECIYDLKPRTLSSGEEIGIYPKSDYEINEEVLYEVPRTVNVLKQSKIIDITFKEYDMIILKGKKMKEYGYYDQYTSEIDDNQIYAIKNWKPIFVMEDGIEIKYETQLYKLQK